MAEQLVLFDPRFLESYAGHRLLKDPKSALVELIANAWDAGATRVDISWPEKESGDGIQIIDNGHGMTEAQFTRRWLTLAYDRVSEQGLYAEFPADVELPKRSVFGRNGVGRFAGFCFGKEYTVHTWRDGRAVAFRVKRGRTVPIDLEKLEEHQREGHGTKIHVPKPDTYGFPAEQIKAEIGMRFLTDPNFEAYVEGEKVSFNDIPEKHSYQVTLEIDTLGSVVIYVIDTQESDRTTKQHGIAWHVNRRLVGECSWRSFEDQAFIDGRKTEAKRFTFIIVADFLADSVQKDWSGFNSMDEKFQQTNKMVSTWIRDYLLESSKEKRAETFGNVKRFYRQKLIRMSPLSLEKWSEFVKTVQDTCPSIGERDLTQLAGVLANLELLDSKYSLVEKLHELEPSQLHDLYKILDDWTLDMAKVVLDELQIRLKLLEELQQKVFNEKTDEVQELQPLFKRGLWIFGPEFETIEFTSNQGMTTVVQKLFKVELRGSLNRPDFAILPDSTAGFYYYPKYDNEGGEVGVDHLVIVELKKPGVKISTDQKDQCWKYIKELYSKGLLQNQSRITCFVLGAEIDPFEVHPRQEREGAVKILPLDYTMTIHRAKSRLLKLYDRVKNAPFLDRKRVEEFLNPIDRNESAQEELKLSNSN